MPRAWAAGSGAGWDGGGLLRVGAQVGWVRGGESTYRPHRCCQPTPQQASESPAAAPRPRGPASGLRPARVRGTSPARADGPVRMALPGRCKATRKVLYPLKLAVHKSSDTGKQAWLAACTEQGVPSSALQPPLPAALAGRCRPPAPTAQAASPPSRRQRWEPLAPARSCSAKLFMMKRKQSGRSHVLRLLDRLFSLNGGKPLGGLEARGRGSERCWDPSKQVPGDASLPPAQLRSCPRPLPRPQAKTAATLPTREQNP